MSDAPSLRERKKLEARQALCQAALELAAARGFDAVSVEEIAERAGVSRRTFFRTFATKEAVLMERRHAQLAAFKSALMADTEVPPFTAIEQALTALGAEYQRDSARILRERALFASSPQLSAHDQQVDRAFEQVIAEAVAKRSRRASERRQAKYFAAAAVGVLRVAIDEWAAANGKVDIAKVARPALKLLSRLVA